MANVLPQLGSLSRFRFTEQKVPDTTPAPPVFLYRRVLQDLQPSVMHPQGMPSFHRGLKRRTFTYLGCCPGGCASRSGNTGTLAFSRLVQHYEVHGSRSLGALCHHSGSQKGRPPTAARYTESWYRPQTNVWPSTAHPAGSQDQSGPLGSTSPAETFPCSAQWVSMKTKAS